MFSKPLYSILSKLQKDGCPIGIDRCSRRVTTQPLLMPNNLDHRLPLVTETTRWAPRTPTSCRTTTTTTARTRYPRTSVPSSATLLRSPRRRWTAPRTRRPRPWRCFTSTRICPPLTKATSKSVTDMRSPTY